MRQVPASLQRDSRGFVRDTNLTHYLIIGDGRLAGHLRTYLSLENLSFEQWSRRRSDDVIPFIERATHVLLALSDSAIEEFVDGHPALLERVCVHFSGALVSPKIPSAHPLMTFTVLRSRANPTDELEFYRAIPFVTEKGRAPFTELLPDLTNRHFEIEASKKPLYHALCSMSGNFTVLLWEKVFASFSEKLDLPASILRPYLSQVAQNLLGEATDPKGNSVLTGPLSRGDTATVEKHLAALKGDPYAQRLPRICRRVFSKSFVSPGGFT